MLGPYRISRGTSMLCSIWGVAHNPDVWWVSGHHPRTRARLLVIIGRSQSGTTP
jgi:hypothetical protein